MLAELWDILPHERTPFSRRMKIALGQPVRFGTTELVLMRDRIDGEAGQVRMHLRDVDAPGIAGESELQSFDVGAYGCWVPVAVSSSGTVLFNVIAPAWPMTVAA